MLTKEEILHIFDEHDVIMEGHFQLSSGLHSNRYVQCARIFEYPGDAEKLCRDLAEKVKDLDIDFVAGPAVGAITMAYEMARQLGTPNVFAERENGMMTLRRGFSIPAQARVLLVEDVVTTGGSVRELFPVVEGAGAEVAAVACILDRSGGKADFGVPLFSELALDVTACRPEECPLCASGLELVEPGSRRLRH